MVYKQVVLSGSRAILQSKWRLVLSDKYGHSKEIWNSYKSEILS